MKTFPLEPQNLKTTHKIRHVYPVEMLQTKEKHAGELLRWNISTTVQMSKGTWLTPRVAAWLLANPPLTCRRAIIYCSAARLALQQASGYLMQMFPNESDGKYQQALRNCG